MFFAVITGSGVQGQTSQHGAAFVLNADIDPTSNVFQQVTATDSVRTQIKGTITEVCQAKGCWMKVQLTDGEQVFVRFKDYGFFVPTDAAGDHAVLNGLAFLEEMSVEDRRHYAADKGASAEEVAQITAPKRTLRFEADGVRISPQD